MTNMVMTPLKEFKQHMEERQTFVREAGHDYSVGSTSIINRHRHRRHRRYHHRRHRRYHHRRHHRYHHCHLHHQAAYWMGETGTGSNDNDWGKIVRFLQVGHS